MSMLLTSETLYSLVTKIAEMSRTASVVIVFVLAARLLLKKAPKIFSYALWAVVLFRLLCPVSVTSDYSLLGWVDASMDKVSEEIENTDDPASQIGQEAFLQGDLQQSDIRQGNVQQGDAPQNSTVESGTWQNDFSTDIWLTGVLVMVIRNLASFIRLRRRLGEAVRLRDNIYLADYIESPFVLGLMRPRIYLPSTLADHEQKYIILHEQHHIRRGDHIIKVLAFAALCIHWFNPLVWAAFLMAGRDMEMSCDEAVIKKIGADIRADYSASLLSLATGRRIIAGVPLAFGEGDTRGRIKNLARWNKPKGWIVALAAAFCIITAVLLFTDSDQGSEETVQSIINISDSDYTYPGYVYAVQSYSEWKSASVEKISPGQTAFFMDEIEVTEDDARLEYYVSWARAGLTLEVGLMAEDGTEYIHKYMGGFMSGGFMDIPAGRYQLFVRNSEDNLQYAETTTETLDISPVIIRYQTAKCEESFVREFQLTEGEGDTPWMENELTAGVPELTAGRRYVSWSESMSTDFNYCDVSEEKFLTYIEQLENTGFERNIYIQLWIREDYECYYTEHSDGERVITIEYRGDGSLDMKIRFVDNSRKI